MKNILLSFLTLITTIPGIYAQTEAKASVEERSVMVYITAANTDMRISGNSRLKFAPQGQPLETQPSIFIDPSKTYQTFIGIGAALTDAAAETFAKLPADKQEEFLKAYYDTEQGIGYTLARTNINSCDFSSKSYTYVRDYDKLLKSFSIAPDAVYKIPFIKRCMEAAGGKLPLYASPWSPPAWMKDNGNMLQGGKLLPEYYQLWADYFVKFIKAYREEKIPIWGITVQNEPMAKQTWESCMYTAEEERNFIRNYLGPTLLKAKMKDVKLIAWDHNRDLIYHRASTILSDSVAAKYVWGIGFHWYESWTGAPIYGNIQRVAEAYPDKPLLLTEACNYPFSWDTFDQWQWGENYGEAMIHDFNNGAAAWTDWNILLDETGGPNHVGNFCFAPVHAMTDKGSLHYMNSYYYIGHFSKFIRPGAQRIGCSSSRAQLMATAFRNTDGTIAVVVMNRGASEVSYRMYVGNQAVEAVSLPHSIMTLVF
jgi:glucosylceramidase